MRTFPLRGASAPALILAGGTLIAAGLPAQVVTGRVVDSRTGEPVATVAVELLAGEDEVQARVATNEAGRFRLRGRTAGSYRLRASRIGLQTVTTSSFDLVRDEEPLEVEVGMGVEAIPLAPMTIVSDRPARVEHLRLHIRGFYERQRTWGREGMGFGQFMGPEELERRILFQPSDALRDLRGVRVLGVGGRRQGVVMRNRRCPPALFVDGARIRRGAIDDFVSAPEILAMEVYVSGTGPPEFTSMCGSIVVWTGAR
jgi:hypothetical protein